LKRVFFARTIKKTQGRRRSTEEGEGDDLENVLVDLILCVSAYYRRACCTSSHKALVFCTLYYMHQPPREFQACSFNFPALRTCLSSVLKFIAWKEVES